MPARRIVRRARRIARRIALIALALIALVIAVGLIVVHTDWGRDKIRGAIAGALRDTFPCGVTIGALEGSVLGDAVVKDVELKDCNGRPAVKVARVELNLALGSLFDKTLRFEYLRASGVVIQAVKPHDGPLNLIEMLHLSPEPFGWNVALDHIEVPDVAIVVDAGGRIAHVDRLTLAGDLGYNHLDGSVHAAVTATGGWREKGAGIGLDAQVAYASGVITAPHIGLTIDGIELDASGLRYAGPHDATGKIDINVAKAALQRFYPEQPANPAIHLGFTVAPGGDHLAVMVEGVAGEDPGKATLYGQLAVMPTEGPRIGGLITITGANANVFAPTAVPTHLTANVLLGLQVDRGALGTRAPIAGLIAVSGSGTIGDLELDQLDASLVIADGKVHAAALARAPGEATARATARFTLEDQGAIVIDHGHVVAAVGNIHDVAPFARTTGALAIDVDVTGTLSDRPPVLTIDGTVVGRHLHRDRVRIARADVRIRKLHLDTAHPSRPHGGATAVLTGATIGGRPVPTTTVTIDSRRGEGYQVAAHGAGDHLGPGGAAWAVDLDAVVVPGDRFRSVTVRLGDYALRTAGVPWAGRGGTIEASRSKITVKGVAGKVDGGTFAVDGTLHPGSGKVDGTVRLTKVELAHVDRALDLSARGLGPLRGDADLTAELHQDHGKWTGTIAGTVRGFAWRPETAPIDVAIDATLAPTRVVGSLTAKGAAIGEVAVALDVAPPRDPTDLAAWAKLDRRAITTATVHAVNLDLVEIARAAGIPPPIEGTVSADLSLTATGSVGEIHARDLVVPHVPGMVDLDATLDLAQPGQVVVAATASVRAIARGTIDGTIRIPTRPFDVRAWRALDVTAIQGITVGFEEIELDDKLAARLGLGTIRGRIAGSIEIAAAFAELHARLAARRITGGPITRPVDLVLDVGLDASGGRAEVVGSIDGVTVMTGTATAPVDPERLPEGMAYLATVPLEGSGTLAKTELAPLLRTFGEERNVKGTVRGEGTLTGSLTDPTATATVVIEGFGGKNSRVNQLTLDGRYHGGVVTAKLDADQVGGGTLHATATYDRAKPEATAIALEASKFQIAPVVRLIPNVIGVRGVLDANLTLTGFDPATATATGMARIRGAQIPMIDEVGAITNGMVDLKIRPGHASVAIKGSVESGEVELRAEADLDGLLPRKGTIDLGARDITMISTMQPQFAANLHADLTMVDDRWQITARMFDTRVVVPDQTGKPLHRASPPVDMVFVEKGREKTPPRAAMRAWLGQRPTNPFARIKLTIEPVTIESKELRGVVQGNLDIRVGDDGISIDGLISARRGEVMVFDRRYLLAKAELEFDGGIDPILDIEMSHDFPDVQMQVRIQGRLSDPELALTSTGAYTDGQLLGFLLGGSPGGPGQDSRDALSGAAAAVASQTVGGFVTRKLPVKIDVLRYEAATSSSSAAFALGKWVTSKLLVLIRSRIEPREDENRGETELEYWLGRRVLLDAAAGDRGVLGLDLLWTRRW